MSLKLQLESDMKDALRGGEKVRLETIRGLRGALRNREIEVGHELDDDEAARVIRSLVKQRSEAAERYREGERPELAEKEEQERGVLEGYLPAAPDANAMEAAVREAIQELGASGPRDMGKVMKAALAKLGGAADGKAVSELARRLLSDP